MLFVPVVEGVSKLLGGLSEEQLSEGQEEQVMLVSDEPQDCGDEDAVAMLEEPCGVTGLCPTSGGFPSPTFFNSLLSVLFKWSYIIRKTGYHFSPVHYKKGSF